MNWTANSWYHLHTAHMYSDSYSVFTGCRMQWNCFLLQCICVYFSAGALKFRQRCYMKIQDIWQSEFELATWTCDHYVNPPTPSLYCKSITVILTNKLEITHSYLQKWIIVFTKLALSIWFGVLCTGQSDKTIIKFQALGSILLGYNTSVFIC